MSPQDDHRAVVLTRRERNRLASAAKYLERKNFKQDAEVAQAIAARFDANEGYTVIHRSAIGPPDPEARAA